MNELLASFDNCLIYKVNSKKALVYYLCVPKMDVDDYQMFLGFPDIDLNKISNDELIKKMKEVIDNIQTINYNSIYVLPDISISHLEEAAKENDNPYYNKILKEMIQPITADVYEMLITTSYGKKKMDRIINIIKKTDVDKKFAGWLSMRLGEKNIKEIDYNKLCEKNVLGDEVAINYSLTLADYQDNVNQQEKTGVNNNPIKKLTPSKNNNISPGFSSIKFIALVLLFSLVIGFVIAAALLIE